MRRNARWSGRVLVVAMACCALAGCYKRVIRAEGFTTSTEDVYKPSREPDVIDDLMWGKSGTKEKK